MKVKNSTASLTKSSAKSTGNTKPEGTMVTTSGNNFLNVLESIIPSNGEQTRELNNLWKDLPEVERKFLNLPSLENLQVYRKMVKEILNLIIEKNTKLEMAKRRGSSDNKILMTVKIIDEKIQLLATTILNKSNSAFTLLKQLESIRGLLFDMTE
ncbi:MAG: YaaR family protein [Leptospira sp.]|nr:YaaR family protein [Leptospira sp.]